MDESKFLALPPQATEVVEVTDAMQVNEADSAKMSFFCTYWPQIAPGILLAIEQLKWPWWKFAAKMGVSLVDSLHAKLCNIPA